ncbi:PAS domain S-box protein, partial [Candidatus Poribacteria bacterium]|nr:PAS domain S-box protein [Candidatus Poribacteria bacterium]
KQNGISVSIIKPQTYGIDFYGDCLYTSENELKNYPERVKRFREASLKGWEYAMSKPNEIIDIIINKYNAKKSGEHLKYEADKMQELIMPDLIEIGHMNPGRWKHIANTYVSLGLAESEYSLEGFIYNPEPEGNYTWVYWIMGIMTLLISAAFVSNYIFISYNRHLKQAVLEKTEEIRKINMELEKNRANLQTLIDNTEDIMVSRDLNNRVMVYNKAFADITKELFGVKARPELNTLEHLTEEKRKHWENILNQVKMGQEHHEEFTHVFKDGSVRYYEIFFKPIFNGDVVIGTAEFSRDITEYKRFQEELMERKAVLEKSQEIANIGSYVWDMRDDSLEWSKNMYAIAGLDPDNFAGNLSEVIQNNLHPDDRDRVTKEIQDMIKNKKTASMEFRLIRPDGDERYLRSGAEFIFDENGNPIKTVGVHFDLTKLREMEINLQQSEEHYRRLVESSEDLIFSVDRDGVYHTAGGSRLRDFGLTPDDVIGKSMVDISSPEIAAEYQAKHDKVFETSLPITYEHEVDYAGVKRYDLTTVFPIKNEDGHVELVGVICRDITERRQLEAERLKVQKLGSISTLAAGIAHDFNNILTAVMGNVSMAESYLITNKPVPRVLERVQAADKALQQAEELSTRLLTFAKGGLPVKELGSIKGFLEESAEFMLTGSDSKCEFQLSEDLWFVEFDPGQINQVINNILLNAQQAMPNGGTVKIKAENTEINGKHGLPLESGPYVKISISDEGIGISEKHLEKIFDPFFTTKQLGSGLGLSTSFSIIDKHGGIITVESEIGVGTTFHIYLPASHEKLKEKREILESVQPGMDISGSGKILVMDDEEFIREMVEDMLSERGFQVIQSEDGKEAVNLYRESMESDSPFDMVILDLTVPGGMGGKKAIEKLQEIDPHVKAVVSSGYSNDPVMANFQEYGFSGVVAKPYKSRELVKILNEIMDNS